MTFVQVVVLSLIQGLTEFLPVSSSAHLIFPSKLLDWEDQGLAFDVAVHVGTLMAVIFYYFSDISRISLAVLEACVRRRLTVDGKVGFCIIIGTVPVCVAGLLFEELISTWGRSLTVIAWATIGFGLLLGIASYLNRHMIYRMDINSDLEQPDSLKYLTYPLALFIGLMQAVAIIPGTSRSGITLTAGLLAGLRPQAAAKFCFLLSIPVILASGVFEGVKLYTHPELLASTDFMLMSVGVFLSFFTALAVIHLFMKFIARSGMALFVIYRLILGAVLLSLF